jgi:acyl-CoA thioesterase FadM
MYRRPVTIHFDQADPAGVLFFARLLEVAHRVYEGFVTDELGTSWASWFRDASLVVPIRRAEAIFEQPLRPGRSYEAEIRITRIGESSFEVTTRFLDLERGEPMRCAETKVTHVFADLARGAKVPIPSDIKARLEAHLER